jgi:dTDP-glucose 4,6-dehydratase
MRDMVGGLQKAIEGNASVRSAEIAGMKLLLTGGAGFSGSHLADAIMDKTDWDLIVLDALTYAGSLGNLARLFEDAERLKRFTFIRWDFSKPLPLEILDQCDGVDYIVHLGAETHVRNSLINPEIFVRSNIVGTYNMLEAARVLKPKKFLYTSTDEVFGASIFPRKETDALNPSNPYSASKAAGEMLVRAYGDSFELPFLITRTSNIYGTRQHEEKFIPMVQQKIRNNEEIEIHTNPFGDIGSRQWIHVSDQAAAILFLLRGDQINNTFHVAGERKTNLEVAQALGAENIHLVNAFKQYPGHDLHYSLNDFKLRSLGWYPQLTFEQGIALRV